MPTRTARDGSSSPLQLGETISGPASDNGNAARASAPRPIARVVNAELWASFDDVGNEMVLTRSGRYVFDDNFGGSGGLGPEDLAIRDQRERKWHQSPKWNASTRFETIMRISFKRARRFLAFRRPRSNPFPRFLDATSSLTDLSSQISNILWSFPQTQTTQFNCHFDASTKIFTNTTRKRRLLKQRRSL